MTTIGRENREKDIVRKREMCMRTNENERTLKERGRVNECMGCARERKRKREWESERETNEWNEAIVDSESHLASRLLFIVPCYSGFSRQSGRDSLIDATRWTKKRKLIDERMSLGIVVDGKEKKSNEREGYKWSTLPFWKWTEDRKYPMCKTPTMLRNSS